MRIKRGTTRARDRKRLLNRTKGFRLGRSKLVRQAKTAVLKAGVYAYRDRRNKKRTFRRDWQVRINTAVRRRGLTYSKFIHLLDQRKIVLDRKILAELAHKEPKAFAAVLDAVLQKG